MRREMRTGLKYAVAAMAAVSMAVTGCTGSEQETVLRTAGYLRLQTVQGAVRETVQEI